MREPRAAQVVHRGVVEPRRLADGQRRRDLARLARKDLDDALADGRAQIRKPRPGPMSKGSSRPSIFSGLDRE